ncbi:hypothetical protein KL921_001496 [Ogataea angusta]|nr:hypothetical protein KL921_001496 [Ogataea angusta]KAG7834572.1 hypothetical protein KL943_002956 [Ogataea angusta]
MSYTLKRNLSLSSTEPLEKIDSPATNSLKSMSPPLFVSKMSITRLASGFCPIPGIDRNSSLSMAPELSVSSFMNRLARRSISSDPTGGLERAAVNTYSLCPRTGRPGDSTECCPC